MTTSNLESVIQQLRDQGALVENLSAFNNHLPVKVRFGEGVAQTLPAVVAELGALGLPLH